MSCLTEEIMATTGKPLEMSTKSWLHREAIISGGEDTGPHRQSATSIGELSISEEDFIHESLVTDNGIGDQSPS